MPDFLRDGTGKGYLARVNADGQLVARATAVEQRLHAALDANYFEATTGKVTLTDANETGMIYLSNGHTSYDLVIDRVFYDVWTSTGGSGADGTLYYHKNPTYTGGSAIVPNGCNFTSTAPAQGTFLKSLTTLTGTKWWTAYLTDKLSIALEEGRIVIPPGASFGISVAAPTGNTSMAISINVAFYYLNSALI